MVAFGVISALAAQGVRVPDGRLGRRFRRARLGRALQPRPDHGPAADRRHGPHRDRPRREEGSGRLGRARRPASRSCWCGPPPPGRRHDRAHRRRAAPHPRRPATPTTSRSPCPTSTRRSGSSSKCWAREELYRSDPGTGAGVHARELRRAGRMRASRWRCCACRPTSTWSCSSGAAPTGAPSTRGTATPAGTTCASWSTTWTRRSRVLARIPGVRVLGDRKEVAWRQPPRRGQPMDLLPHAVGTADGDRRPFPGGRPAGPGRPRRLARGSSNDNTRKDQ